MPPAELAVRTPPPMAAPRHPSRPLLRSLPHPGAGCGHGGTRQSRPARTVQPCSVSPAAMAGVRGCHRWAAPVAGVSAPAGGTNGRRPDPGRAAAACRPPPCRACGPVVRPRPHAAAATGCAARCRRGGWAHRARPAPAPAPPAGRRPPAGSPAPRASAAPSPTPGSHRAALVGRRPGPAPGPPAGPGVAPWRGGGHRPQASAGSGARERAPPIPKAGSATGARAPVWLK